PVIEGFTNNSGDEGTVFTVNGRNFDQPGLTVKVCGVAAAHELLPSGDLEVTAPECGPGPAVVEICTEFGCDSDPQGFTYPTPPGAPEIESFESNSGEAGQIFYIVGQNFDAPGLSVQVCNVAAEFTLLAVNLTISVAAPLCGTVGPVQARVCTEGGCDLDPAGFTYVGSPTDPLSRRGDSNADARVDLSDGIATLGYLFLGTGEPPCLSASDANDSGAVDLADAVYT